MPGHPSRTFERACPEHRELLDEHLHCPRGHSVLPDPRLCRSLRGHDGLANTLLWCVVEVSAGEIGREVAKVYGVRVEWAAWFWDELALTWRQLHGRDDNGLSPAAPALKWGLKPGERKLLMLTAA